MVEFVEGEKEIGRFELSSLVGIVKVMRGDACEEIRIPEHSADLHAYQLAQAIQGTVREVQEGGYSVSCDKGQGTSALSIGGAGKTLEDAFMDLVTTAVDCYEIARALPEEDWHPGAVATLNYWKSLFT